LSPTENSKDQFKAESSCYILEPPLHDEQLGYYSDGWPSVGGQIITECKQSPRSTESSIPLG